MEHTLAVGAYAAHILEILWHAGAVIGGIGAAGAGYLIGKERGAALATKEYRKIEELRRVRAQVEADIRRQARWDIEREKSLSLDTPRPDRAHVCSNPGCKDARTHH